MDRSTLATALLATGALLVIPAAGAVGIGEYRVESHLGEPLDVRIGLRLQPDESVDTGCVQVGTPPGRPSPYLGDLTDLSFEVRALGERRAEVVITSRRPFTEPILVFPLKLGCPGSGGGVTYRELTFLIDPAGRAAPARAATATPVRPRAPASAPSPSPERRPAEKRPDGETWRVQRGQTLSGIIVATGLHRGSRRRLQALIDAVVDANPGVFRGRGPDYLPAGAVLTIPGWDGTTTAAAGGRGEAAPSPTPAPQAPERGYRLELTTPDSPVGEAEVAKLEAGINELEESAARERAEYRELQDRLARLQENATALEVTAQRLATLLAELRSGDVTEEAMHRLEAAVAAGVPEAVAEAEAVEPDGASGEDAAAAQPLDAVAENEPAGAAAVPAARNPVEDGAASAPPLPERRPQPLWSRFAVPLTAAAVVLLAFLLARLGRRRDEEALAPVRRVARPVRPFQPAQPSVATTPPSPPPAPREESPPPTPPPAADTGKAPVGESRPQRVEVEVEEVDNLLEQVEVLLLFGEPQEAIDLLQQHIAATEQEAVEPRPWLKLLQVLRSEMMREEFVALAGRFKRVFNIERPRWETFGAADLDSEGVTLEESCPHLVRRLEQVWDDPAEAVRYLESIILDDRDGTRTGFAHSVANELLLLRDVARDRLKT